jgi:hypothetical protein
VTAPGNIIMSTHPASGTIQALLFHVFRGFRKPGDEGPGVMGDMCQDIKDLIGLPLIQYMLLASLMILS